jgi:hypothetical protein
MINATPRPSKDSDTHPTTEWRKRRQEAQPGGGLPSRIVLPSQCLRQRLIKYLQDEDQLGRQTVVVLEDARMMTWGSVRQLFAWAVAKREAGGELVLEFQSAAGWINAQRTGLTDQCICRSVFDPQGPLQSATPGVQPATGEATPGFPPESNPEQELN